LTYEALLDKANSVHQFYYDTLFCYISLKIMNYFQATGKVRLEANTVKTPEDFRNMPEEYRDLATHLMLVQRKSEKLHHNIIERARL